MTKSSINKTILGAVIVIVAFLSLLALGTWQLQRMAWKTNLLASIELGLAAEPVALEDSTTYAEYTRIVAEGRYNHDKEQYLYTIGSNGNPGFNVYTPLIRDGKKTIIINRGFVPPEMLEQDSRATGLPEAIVQVVGVLRNSALKKYFIPENEINKNRWFYADHAAMVAAMGLNTDGVSSMFLELDEGQNSTPPFGGVTRVNLPNNHLGYAVTWYGLALALLVVVFIYRRKQ
jgi:surfeit locus 1 family protein